jgi:hypothetical protein
MSLFGGVSAGGSGADGTGDIKRTVFSASGTFTKDPKAKIIRVQMWGGGGGGANGQKVASGTLGLGGSAGGGGSYAEASFPASAFGASEAVTVGAGGAGSPSTTTSTIGSGNNGGTSQLGTSGALLQAFGGNPGNGVQAGAGGNPFGFSLDILVITEE